MTKEIIFLSISSIFLFLDGDVSLASSDIVFTFLS